MESAPARAQSRIPPFRLSKTVQPAPHKGQRRWLPHFSGQSSSADAKNGAKKRVFPKCLLSPRGTRAGDDSVPTHTMLRAALKLPLQTIHPSVPLGPNTHNAACGIETVRFRQRAPDPTHTMLRAALKPKVRRKRPCPSTGPNTHNAACGIETTSRFASGGVRSQSRHTQCCVRH